MLNLLRRNIYFIWPYLLGMMLIPIFFYLIQFPRVPFSTYIILLYILLASSFHMEKVKHVDRFIISLPVSKRKVVLARYIELTVAVSIGTGLMLLFEATVHHTPAARSLITISIIFTIIFTIIAAALPIFYYFDKMWEAILAQIFMMIAGNIIFFVIVFSSIFDVPVDIILHIVDLQPTVVMTLFSLTLLISSYFLSCFIYEKKDH